MKRLYFMFMLVLTMVGIAAALAHGQRTLKSRVPQVFTSTGIHAQQSSKAIAKAVAKAESTVSPKAYGVKIYSDATSNANAIVSFDVNDPSNITEEISLDGYTIRGGVCIDDVYYLIDAPYYIANQLISVDLNTKQISTVATYETYSSASSLIITDMTYDPTTKNVYILAYDLSVVEEEYEDSYALGLYTLDVQTGEVTSVGYQYYTNLVTLAADPNGELYGLDDYGSIWHVDKSSGTPDYDLGYVEDVPSSLQSMSYDLTNNVLYWAGFSVTTEYDEETEEETEVGSSFLYSLTLDDEGYFTATKIGSLQDNTEIVALYINPDPLPKGAPAAVSDLTAACGENGDPTVTLNWTNPATTIGGDALEQGFKINIYRNDALVTSLENQTASAAATYTDENVPSSMVCYKIVGENESGEGTATYTDSLYVGRDVPGAVQGLSATKGENYDITLSWSQPTEGMNKGWFDKTTLKYNIVRYPDEVAVATDLEATTFTDQTITELHGYYYKVTAVNADGEGASVESSNVVQGPAIEELPYTCDFSTDDQYRLWTIVDNDQDGQTWYLESNYGGTSDWFLKYFPDQELNPDKVADDWFISAPIKLSASKNYLLSYSIRLAGSLFPFDYTITAGSDVTPETQTQVIEECDSVINNFTLEAKSVSFTVAADGVYHIGFQARNAVSAQFTNIEIREVPSVDLQAVSVTGFTAIPTNSETSYNVIVKNCGGNTINDYTVSLVDAEGTELVSKSFAEEITTQATDTVSIGWTPTEKGDFTIYAKVTVTDDADDTNDVSESGLTVTVIGDGEWHHVTEGTRTGASTPFRLRAKESTAQTIYTKDELGAKSGQSIEAIAYYYYIYGNNPVVDCSVKIYMANTGLDDWSGDKIAQEDWTLVYNGTMSCPVGLDCTPLILDKPFKYTGGNLAVMSSYSGTGEYNKIYFYYTLHSDVEKANGRTCYYYGSTAYTFTETMTQTTDVANASFFVTGTGTGISSVEADSDLQLVIADGSISVAGGFDALHVYDVVGRTVLSKANAQSVSTSALNAGTYIVVVEKDGKQLAKKVVITK